MGLFGYNAKDYNKNSEIFKGELQQIYQNLAMRGINEPEVGNALTSIINMFDWFSSYPSSRDADSKQQKAIDEYIAKIISDIRTSAQQRNSAKLVLQAKMLNELICDARSNGRLHRSMEDLKAREVLNACLGELNQVGVQKEEFKRRKQAILAEAKRLEALGAPEKIVPLKNEYMQIESKEKTLARKENELSKTYQYNCDALANAEDRGFYKELGAGNFVAMSPQQVGKLVQEIGGAIEKNNEAVTSGMDILKDFEDSYMSSAGSISSSSSFESDFESSKLGDTMNSVNGATYTPGVTTENSSSSFDQAFKNF